MRDVCMMMKEKSGVKCGIVVRSAEIFCERNVTRQSGIKEYFMQSYFQMINSASCNYHFVLCYIFLKHYQDKEEISSFLIEEMLKDIDKTESQKSNRNLILNLSLLINLINNHFHIQPIKFKIKEMLSKLELLASPIAIHQLVTVYYKEVSILKH